MTPNGEWADVFLPEGHVAVLAGYTLERATCGLIKAAKHRVVCLQQLLYSIVHTTYSALQESSTSIGAYAQETSQMRLPF
jgi:hypothetical protein